MTTIQERLAIPCTARTPGLAGYKIDRCRCHTCTTASNEHRARRDKLIAYGRWQPYVNAEPVRAHIRNVLRPAGFGARRIATLAGLSPSTVNKLIWGYGDRPPVRRIRPEAAAAILALQPEPAALADGAQVDATGTRRRTQAMAVLGWSIAEQARRLGRTGANHAKVLTSRYVTAALARSVEALCRDLSGQIPPDTWVSRRTRRWARSQGWVAVVAWNDIDDPAEVPHLDADEDLDPEAVDEVAVARVAAGNAGINSLHSRSERLAAVATLAGRGMTVAAIANRVGTNCATVRRLLDELDTSGQQAA